MKDVKLADILKLEGKDIISLNREDLYDYVKIAMNRASRRVDRLKEYLVDLDIPRTNINSDWLKEGLFSYNKDMTLNELRHKLATAKTFLSLQGSRVGGQKDILKRFSERLGIDIKTLSKDNQDRLWRVYRDVKDLAINKYYSSTQLQREIYDLVQVDKEKDSIIKKILKKSNEIYEKESLKEAEKEQDDGLDI